jgi:hypothetical protein
MVGANGELTGSPLQICPAAKTLAKDYVATAKNGWPGPGWPWLSMGYTFNGHLGRFIPFSSPDRPGHDSIYTQILTVPAPSQTPLIGGGVDTMGTPGAADELTESFYRPRTARWTFGVSNATAKGSTW